MFDSLVNQHNIHKAEQSNDVTCVVSGIPQYIDTHAAEIANFAIHVMQSVEEFKVEDLPDVQIKVRIGIHTGRFVCVVARVFVLLPVGLSMNNILHLNVSKLYLQNLVIVKYYF